MSEVTIQINPSRDYKKILFLTYLMTGIIIYISSLSNDLLFLSALVLCVLYFASLTRASFGITQLLYRGSLWYLVNAENRRNAFERCVVKYDLGLVVLLELTKMGRKQKIYLFKDQINIHDRKLISVYSKISDNTTFVCK